MGAKDKTKPRAPTIDQAMHNDIVYSVKAGHNAAMGTRVWILKCANMVDLRIDGALPDQADINGCLMTLVPRLQPLTKDQEINLNPKLDAVWKWEFDVSGRSYRRVVELSLHPQTPVEVDREKRQSIIDRAKRYAAGLGLDVNRTSVSSVFSKYITKPEAIDDYENALREVMRELAAMKPQSEDKTVTAPTTEAPASELDEHIKRSSITRTNETRQSYFAARSDIYERFGVDSVYWDEYGKEALSVESHDDWQGTPPEALHKVLLFCMDMKPKSDATADEFKALLVNGGAKLTDFKAATGFANRQDAYDNGKKPSDLYATIQGWLESRKLENAPKSNQEGEIQKQGATAPVDTKSPQTARQSESGKPTQRSSGNPFQKATKGNSKLRLALGGVPGGGKTYTALQIARAMFPDGKIAVLDTESGSAEKYADIFDFDVLDMVNDFSPEHYIDMIHAAEDNGYDVVILDSLSHEWDGTNGVLDLVDGLKEKYRNREGAPDTRAAWREMSPRHNNLIAAIIQSKIHVIATMRCKWKSVAARDENKRPISVKVIGDLVQRDKIQYEFDIVALLDEQQNLTVDKSRCPELTGYRGNRAGAEVANRITKWLNIARQSA